MNPLDKYTNEKWSGPPSQAKPVSKMPTIEEVEVNPDKLTEVEILEQKAKVYCEQRQKQRHLMKKIELPDVEKK